MSDSKSNYEKDERCYIRRKRETAKMRKARLVKEFEER